MRDPGVGALDDPSSGQHMGAFGNTLVPVDLCSFGCPDATQAGPSMLHDFQTDGKVVFDPLFEWSPCIPTIALANIIEYFFITGKTA